MKQNTLFAFVFTCVALWTTPACKKNQESFRPTNAPKIDSILNANGSFHFIYDSLDRVIETVCKVGDTLQERNIYNYYSQANVPFERKHFYRTSLTPDYISSYLYDNNNKKIYDSTYSTVNTNYCVVNINYTLANKMCVVQDLSFDGGANRIHNWQTDTVFLNVNNNIDSIRRYTGASQTSYGGWNYWVTELFEQYDANDNIFSKLSISNCLIYQASDINWGHSYGENVVYPFLDGVSSNNFNVLKYVYPTPYSYNNSAFNRSLFFDVNNIRITENLSNGGFSIGNYKFIYK